MTVHKIPSPNFNFAMFVARGWFCVIGEYEIGDVALLRETFGQNRACSGRAEIFKATSIVNGVTNFTFVPAE
jgi:hypothetical protein